ncbi:MAG: formylglycine-generating enzyme family protein [Bacteroidota bacterium]
MLTFPKPLTLQTLDSHMIRIPAGIYWRGGRDYSDSLPVHQVKLNAFELCRFPVTQALWEAVMEENPSAFPSLQRPVEQVSWEDCLRFLEKINEEVERPFRLPSEAEWEYAARGGKNRDWKFAGSPNVREVAFFSKWDEKSINTSQDISQPAGLRLPNELGLYDISGNIWEWCEDWYGKYPDISEQQGPIYAPKGPKNTGYRVIRGGSWSRDPERAQVADRSSYYPSSRDDYIGFRLARTV